MSKNKESSYSDEFLPEILVDGIGTVSFMGGLIRADLLKLVPNDSQPDKPLAKPAQRLIMSPQAFLQAVDALNVLVERLKESGAIKIQKNEKKEK